MDQARSEQVEFGDPVGSVTVYTSGMVTCAAEWGGWTFYADGLGEAHAREHLRQRLEHLDPFFGGRDYGRFGGPTDGIDQLDPRLPESTRRRIAAYLDATS